MLLLNLISVSLILLVNHELTNCLQSCGDWTPFKQNCIKVIEKKATEEDALKNCTDLDSTSSLVSIHSSEEQEVLNNLISNYKNISENVWIGLKYDRTKFEWLDGTTDDYTNWGDDAVKDGSLACVQMSLGKSSLGKWTDQSCKKTALVVCQRKQTDIDSNNLSKTVASLVQKVEKQQNEINSLKAGSVPIGFIYTQLPNQSTPQTLWPGTNWIDVTQQYAGLFFRAEGADSGSFGQTQSANYSRISNIQAWSSEMYGWRDDRKYGPVDFSLAEGSWTEIKPGGLLYWLKFYTAATHDARPRNTAVRIFKRIN